MILRHDPWIEFSANPMIPWCFGNCAVELSSSDLRRIVKGSGHHGKIDIVHSLEDALHGFDITEGRVSE
jgi:hypothetical protein